MSIHTVSALKYRPGNFADVVGQDAITHTLSNAINQNKLAHAYLFCGPRGVGKTSVARIFAKLVNKGMDNQDQDFAFNIFELDAASNNSVDDIRQLIDQVRIQPQIGEYKIYIIDEVHMLSQSAFNAFLKTLEEPPPHAIFILATTEKHKVLPTIISRCQVYDFSRITVLEIAKHLEKIADHEKIEAEPEALHLIAQKADGALRDALSIFDQIVNFSNGKITYEQVIDNLHLLDYDQYLSLCQMISSGDVSNTFLSFHKILKDGFDGNQVVLGLAEHFRNLMMVQDEATVSLLDVSPQLKKKILQQSQLFNDDFLFRALNILNEADQKYSISKNQNLLVEIALLQLCQLSGNRIEKKRPDPGANFKSLEEENTRDDRKVTKDVDVFVETKTESKTIKPVKKTSGEPIDEVASETTEKTENAVPSEGLSQSKNLAQEPDVELPRESKVSKNIKPKKPKLKIAADSISLVNFETPVPKEIKDVENISPTNPGESKLLEETELLRIWKEYAEIIKEAKKYSFYSTLSNRNPEIKDENTIFLLVENDVQLEDLNEEKVALMSYLRNHLNHPNLQLEADKTEEDASIRLQNPREKYIAMLKKNPTLGKLTEQLDLDLDY